MPEIAIALLAGDFSISKVLTSKLGRKWLLGGVPIPTFVNKIIKTIPITGKASFQTGRINRAIQ